MYKLTTGNEQPLGLFALGIVRISVTLYPLMTAALRPLLVNCIHIAGSNAQYKVRRAACYAIVVVFENDDSAHQAIAIRPSLTPQDSPRVGARAHIATKSLAGALGWK
jgi:hypothetical protein